MKKILIHSLTFPPDTISTGMIVSEIADGLNKELNNTLYLAPICYSIVFLAPFGGFNILTTP